MPDIEALLQTKTLAATLTTSPAIVRKVNAAVSNALAEVQRRVTDRGMETVGGPPEAVTKLVNDEAQCIRSLLKAGVLKQGEYAKAELL